MKKEYLIQFQCGTTTCVVLSITLGGFLALTDPQLDWQSYGASKFRKHTH